MEIREMQSQTEGVEAVCSQGCIINSSKSTFYFPSFGFDFKFLTSGIENAASKVVYF